MKIDLNKLKINDRFSYDEDFKIDLNEYHNEEIKDLRDLHLKGYVYYNSAEILEINLKITGIMVLVDSVSLDNIDYPFEAIIEEEYSLDDEYFKEYYEKEQNILDIMAILWENIVLEVPIGLTSSSDTCMSGDGWQLGQEKNEREIIDPRLAKLAEVLDDRKE